MTIVGFLFIAYVAQWSNGFSTAPRTTTSRVSIRLPPSPGTITTTRPHHRTLGQFIEPNNLLRASLSQQDEVILREFEKKEALIRKRREEAMAKLSEYEDSLEQLKSKKAEYLAAAQMAKPPVGGTFSETTLRSAVKSFVWRIVAGSVTFATTLQFSGSVEVALKVVGADFFSKAFTMFLGERLMNKSKAGRARGSDDVRRSFAKAIIWRLFAICNTLTMAVFVAKDLSIASKIASTDAVFKTALMFFYERVWARVQWGKEYLLEYSI